MLYYGGNVALAERLSKGTKVCRSSAVYKSLRKIMAAGLSLMFLLSGHFRPGSVSIPIVLNTEFDMISLPRLSAPPQIYASLLSHLRLQPVDFILFSFA